MTINFYRLYSTLTLADYLGLLQKSYVFLFRIILENRCLPPDLTLRISSCRPSCNYINLKCEFFQKNWKVSLKYEGCVAGKRWIAFRQSGWLPAICFPAFFLPLFIVSPGSVLVGNPAWKTTPCLFMKKCFKDINEKQLHDFGRSCYFLKSSLIITLIGFVLRFYVFCTFFFTLEDLGETLPRPPS